MAEAQRKLEVLTDEVVLETEGDCDIIDVTGEVQELVRRHHFDEGQVLVFAPGSTAGLTTVEYEPGLLEDLPAAFERLAPHNLRYAHHERWHDGNGHSHVRASLLGPSLNVPFKGGRLLLGTWQQIILVDFDNRPRERTLVVQLTGLR